MYLFISGAEKDIVNGFSSTRSTEPPLASFIRNHLDIDFLQTEDGALEIIGNIKRFLFNYTLFIYFVMPVIIGTRIMS